MKHAIAVAFGLSLVAGMHPADVHGRPGKDPLGDTREWDGVRWTQVSPPGTALDPSAIAGIWQGVARTGHQSATVAFDIRSLAKGVGLFMTLPPLHAWRMPVGYLEAMPGGTWSIPDWKITLRRRGETLIGELGDRRVTFELSRADALPAEAAVPPLPPGPAPDWTYDAGAPLWASPAASDGEIYAGDTRGILHAMRAADGARLWTSDVGAPIHGAVLVSGGALFLLDEAGGLHRLERRSGRRTWRVALGADPAPRVLPAADVFAFDFHSPAPALHDGIIYLASSAGVVHAVAAADGQVRWQHDLKTRVRTTAAVSERQVFVGTLDGDLVALDRRTGTERWRFKATGPITSAATVAGDIVIVASRGSWITALSATTGAPLWERFDWFSWIESTGRIVDGVYYVGSSDRRAVRALDPRTGRTIWETDVLGWAWGTPAVTRDTVYIGVAGPQKYVTKHAAGLVALERTTGAVRWRRPVAADPSAFVSGYPGSVIVTSGMLVAPNVRGLLEGYRVREARRAE